MKLNKSLFLKKIKNNKDLLTITLISLFIFGSCNNPSGIGLDVAPDDQIPVLMTDTITVQSYTVQDDSAYSSSSSFTTFGLFQDPEMGETRVDLALTVLRAENFRRIKPEAQMDSAILVLPYVSDFFGDTVNSNYTIQVRQLDENFATNAASNKNWKVKGEVLGTKKIGRFGYKLTDSLSISKNIDGKDSVIKVIPQMRIALSTDFFKEIFSTSVDSATLASSASFDNHLKGFYIQIEKETSQGIGGIGAIAAVSGISGLELTFRQLSDTAKTSGKIDTVRNFFALNPGNSTTGGMVVSSVKHHYKEGIQNQLDHPGVAFDKIYVQAPAGLRGKFVFPYIDQLKNKNLLINKAELIFETVEAATGGSYHTASPRLTLYREDIAGRRQNIPDGSALSQYGTPLDPRSFNYLSFGGWYQSKSNRYSFFLTSYIQDVIAGKINGNELFVAPVSIFDQIVPTIPAIGTGSRSVLKGSGIGEGQVKLVIHYVQAKP